MSVMFSLAGFVIGITVGLTGLGGGALMLPALILLFQIPPSIAVGTDLAYSVPTKWAGFWQHRRQGHIHWPTVWHLSKGSVPATVIGAYVVTRWVKITPQAEIQLRHFLGVILLFVASVILIHLVFRTQLTKWIPRHWWYTHPWAMTGWGGLVGLFVGSTSIGSGTLLIPYLFLLRLRPREIVGTGVTLSALLVTVAGGIHWWGGTVDLRLAAHLLFGSIPGVLIGARLSQRVPDRALRFLLTVILILTAIHLIRS